MVGLKCYPFGVSLGGVLIVWAIIFSSLRDWSLIIEFRFYNTIIPSGFFLKLLIFL
jgi:hypothetical protein